MADMILAGQFTASKLGVNSLTVTVDVEAIEIATGTRTAAVTGASATAVGRRGLYTYRLTGATPATHVYIGTFITADTSVDQREVAALAMVVPDTLITAVEADTQDIQGRLPALLSSDGYMMADIEAISDVNGVAPLLYRFAEAILDMQVTQTGQTLQFTTTLTGLDESQVLNRLLYYPDTGSGSALRRITGYAAINGRLTLDVALPFNTTSGDKIYFLPTSPAVDAVAISGSTDAADGVEANIGNLDEPISGVSHFDNTADPVIVGTNNDKTGYSLSAAGVTAIIDAIRAITVASITTAGTLLKFIVDKLGLITTATGITVDSPVDGGLLTITKAVSLDSGLLDVTVPAGWTKCLVTGKKDKDDPDTAALFQIVESNPGVGTDGLLYLNGAAAAAANLGSLTVDEANNQARFTLTDDATAQIKKLQTGFWDIKFLVGGNSTRPVAGLLQVVLPVTQTI